MRIEDYQELPYPITLVEEPSVEGRPRIWFAKVEDLPGCMSQGDTADEAIAGVRDAMGAWIADALDEGESVPTPREPSEYSGRFLVRVPRTLHRDLVREAEREKTSLNQFVTSALAAAVQWRAGEQQAHLMRAIDRLGFQSLTASPEPLQEGEIVQVVNVAKLT